MSPVRADAFSRAREQLPRSARPEDARRAKATPREPTARFLAVALPSRQVGSSNPEGVPNVLEQHETDAAHEAAGAASAAREQARDATVACPHR